MCYIFLVLSSKVERKFLYLFNSYLRNILIQTKHLLCNLTHYEFYSLHGIEKFADNIIDRQLYFFYIKGGE